MTVLDLARRTKHRGWLLGRRARAAVISGCDAIHRTSDRARPPRWRAGDYGGTFLDLPTPSPGSPEAVPRRLFVLWTGDNDLTPNRRAAVDELQHEQDLEVVLVDTTTIEDWVLPSHPLHPAYEHLSLVHRSDYLRCYLMHHHGGAYCDIKRGYGDVAACVRRLDGAPDRWILGYPELSSRHAAAAPGELGRALRRHHGLLVGNGAFVLRPRTPLTQQWIEEVERRLDAVADDLARNPGGIWGDTPGYPVAWGDLLGAVLQPLCLKHHERTLADPRMMPSLEDFR